MENISKQKSQRFALFLIIAGIGALWLTFVWNKNDSLLRDFGKHSNLTFYYTFNSIMLLASGILLYTKRLRSSAILSIVLGISVTASMLVFPPVSDGLFSSLFFETVKVAMLGMFCGGPILAPLFLCATYIGLIRGIGILEQKNKNTIPESVVDSGNKKMRIISKSIPVVAFLLGIYTILPGFFGNHFVFWSPYVIVILSVTLLVLPLISFFEKNTITLKIINSIITVILVCLVLYQIYMRFFW